ncbi:hypothetical protein OG394_01140 [Kribbella sp. NBC_01245]|uniref:hypothetical protein n=1 Tax=Kribbella sp. NBC_01245 TaxID=2903578 RepID=UPI002E2E28FA|nr:hypothetical protein [Kribbella sp. NBC_01245]
MTISAYLLPGDWVRPEGITLGPSNDFFSGSSADGTIYRCNLMEPTAEVWSPPGVDGRTVALGMDLYGEAQLVVCGGRTGALFVYDVAGRALISKRVVDGYLNDVLVVGNRAYATDSSRPVVWEFDLLGNEAPKPIDLVGAGSGAYLNGIAATADGTALLVAAQGTEVLWRVELADGSACAIARDFAADGLLLLGDTLIGVCNRGETVETAEFFLAALGLTDNARSAALIGTFADPRFDTPTTLVADGNRLLVVNAQFAKGAAAAPPFQVLVVPTPAFR